MIECPGGMLTVMPCAVRDELALKYETVTRDYSKSVDALRQQSGVVTRAKYEDLKHAAEVARTQSEEARSALEGHISLHGCL